MAVFPVNGAAEWFNIICRLTICCFREKVCWFLEAPAPLFIPCVSENIVTPLSSCQEWNEIVNIKAWGFRVHPRALCLLGMCSHFQPYKNLRNLKAHTHILNSTVLRKTIRYTDAQPLGFAGQTCKSFLMILYKNKFNFFLLRDWKHNVRLQMREIIYIWSGGK